MEKKVALVFLLMYCCVVLNAQPDKVCGRYGDGGECDRWGKRENPGERSTNIKDLLARKVRTSKNRAAREFLKRKRRLSLEKLHELLKRGYVTLFPIRGYGVFASIEFQT
ncbi:unnamed protein product [Porites evermanni]|uniref:Uncharacterized protein n=1 Tax=Porites evermanni TaxID=104178 RepID=A0ABN8LD78_9CNID|nr:unnamed protein product [Porites evermanni]